MTNRVELLFMTHETIGLPLPHVIEKNIYYLRYKTKRKTKQLSQKILSKKQ